MTDSRWLALLVLCTGFLLIVVDMTIVNVALPSISKDLQFTPSGLAWVINAYLVAFAGLLLLAGRLADLIGSKRVFLFGLGMFTSASLVCGLAMIVNMFPEPSEQARAFGIFSLVASAGAAVGLVAGGLIVQAVSWHWIFFVNLPIGVAVAAAALRLLPSSSGRGIGEGADVMGAGLVTAALMLSVYAIVTSSAPIGVFSIALFGAFIVRQAVAGNPLLPLRLFRSVTLSGANAV